MIGRSKGAGRSRSTGGTSRKMGSRSTSGSRSTGRKMNTNSSFGRGAGKAGKSLATQAGKGSKPSKGLQRNLKGANAQKTLGAKNAQSLGGTPAQNKGIGGADTNLFNQENNAQMARERGAALPTQAQAQNPVVCDPATGQPIAQNPVACDPITGQPVAQNPAVCDPATGQPIAQQAGACPEPQPVAQQAGACPLPQQPPAGGNCEAPAPVEGGGECEEGGGGNFLETLKEIIGQVGELINNGKTEEVPAEGGEDPIAQLLQQLGLEGVMEPQQFQEMLMQDPNGLKQEIAALMTQQGRQGEVPQALDAIDAIMQQQQQA